VSIRQTRDFGRMYIDVGFKPFILTETKVPVANCEPCRLEHVRPEQMEACTCLTCHGFYAATDDLDRLYEMIRLHPRGLLAIRTGDASGIAVVDNDPRGLPEMHRMVAAGMLPPTATEITGRGGYHMVYAHPGDGKICSGADKIAPGIDSKSDGGYVVVAPSVHPQTGRSYQWLRMFTGPLAPLPDHLVDLLREPARQPRPANPVTLPAGPRASRYGEAALRRELEKLLALKGADGIRNDTLAKESAFSLGQLVAGGVLDRDRTAALLQEAGERIGLEPGETRRAIASGFRAGALSPRGGAS
jgi:hypothetical protein